ncbi:hypothetical protein K7X08_033472 [Anisodus acutangulus]|uniref:Uncharacterized protein n=1 Tax=Anisodus acutangulus TaxID=402998 RepID=A0A9Q1RA53_9SOLA|nr:hypothetical protein K7X08_033472 [Anisodus acutangulus]
MQDLKRVGKVKGSGGTEELSMELYVSKASWWAPSEERRWRVALKDLVVEEEERRNGGCPMTSTFGFGGSSTHHGQYPLFSTGLSV